jgi:hypothetical protein
MTRWAGRPCHAHWERAAWALGYPPIDRTSAVIRAVRALMDPRRNTAKKEHHQVAKGTKEAPRELRITKKKKNS